jgi:hypothetical protein
MELSELTGKTILVAMTFLNQQGQELQREHLFGRVFDTGPQGIVLLLEPSGREFALPPHTRNLTAAEPREYTLEPGGETVRPDYLATWTVTRRE